MSTPPIGFSGAQPFAPTAPAPQQQAATPPSRDQFERTSHTRDPRTGADVAQVQTASGVQYSQVTQGSTQVCTAILPKGLLPAALQIQAQLTNGTLAGISANLAGRTLQAQLLPGARAVVDLGVNNLIALFDANTRDYGIATKPVPQAPALPGGQTTFQALKEIVHIDGSRTIIAGETDTVVPQNSQDPNAPPLATNSSFYQFEDHNGQVEAKHVAMQAAHAGSLATAVTQTPMQASRQSDGAYVATPPNTGAAVPPGLSPALSQLLASPVEAQRVKPFSAYAMTDLYGALATPATPDPAAFHPF